MQRAVLTGDIVGSTGLSETELADVFRMIEATAREIAVWQQASTRLTRSRGDGWQLMLTEPRLALRAALAVMAGVQALGTATRVAAATGTGRPGDAATLEAASGAAFIASGRALDTMDPNVRLASPDGGAVSALFRLADALASDWTQAQSRAVALKLPPAPPTNAQIGTTLGISRQAVEKALAGAKFGAIEDALTLIEAAYD